jgi:hypothetical protein
MATVLFLEAGSDATSGLEFYSGTQISGGTVASDSTQQEDGINSIKCATTGGSGSYAIIITGNAILADAGRAISLWVRFPSVAPSADLAFISSLVTGDGSTEFAVGLSTTGKLAIQACGATEVIGTTVLAANTWYRVSVSYVLTSTVSWTIKVFLNGVLEVTSTNAQGTLTNMGGVDLCLGPTFDTNIFNPFTAFSMYFDSVYVDNRTDLTDPGNIHVTAKRPFANGTTNGFTTQIGSGGSGYGSGHAPQVNERPLNQADGWSAAVVASAITEEYNIEGVSVGDANLTGATIVGVEGWIFAKSTLTETDKILVDGTQTSILVTSTAALFTQLSPNPTTYPAGTGTDIGMVTNTTAATASLYECGVLVAYIPSLTPPCVPYFVDVVIPPKAYPSDLRTSSYNLLESTLRPQPFNPLLLNGELARPATPAYPSDLRTSITDLLANTLKPAQTFPAVIALTAMWPPMPPYALDLRTATVNLQQTTLQPVAQARGTYDQPLPPVLPYPRDLRTSTLSLQTSTLPAAPFVDQWWDSPPTRPYPLDLRTATQNLLVLTLAPVPVALPSDVALPSGRLAYPSDLRTSTTTLVQSTLFQAAFVNADPPWLPTRPYALDLRTAVVNLQQTTLQPATPPFRPDDQPLPPVLPYPLDLRTFISYYQLDQNQPFISAIEYHVPWQRSYALEWRTATMNLIRTTLAAPIEHYDWPNPPVTPYALELRTALGNLLESTLVPAAAPVPARDWPNPPTRPYALDLRTATLSLQTSTLPAAPFVDQLWDSPPTTPYPMDLRTSVCHFPLGLSYPVVATVDGVPPTRPYPLDLRTGVVNLLGATLQYPFAPDLSEQALPTLTHPYPPDLRTALQILITTTLKPAQTFPAVMDVDALPPVRPYALDLRTAVVNLLTTTLTPAPQAPHLTDLYQLDVTNDFGNTHTPNVGGLHF